MLVRFSYDDSLAARLGRMDALVAWIGAHPIAAGLAIFLVVFCDALVILGIVVPAFGLLTLRGARLTPAAERIKDLVVA